MGQGEGALYSASWIMFTFGPLVHDALDLTVQCPLFSDVFDA